MNNFPYKVSSFGLTDVGLVRQNNEDAWHRLEDLNFFVLADGMGGHQAGEVASNEAVTDICKRIKKQILHSMSLRLANKTIRQAIENTNHVVHQMGRGDRKLRGMGTTLCCLYFHPNGLIYANVGDSRIYRYRNKKIEQLTIDHSLLADLELVGEAGASLFEEMSYRNIITKAIGTEPSVEPTVHECHVQDEDIYLMCSDGLSDLLKNSEIERIIGGSYSLEVAAKHLIDQANIRGGHDNVTVVLTQVKINNDLSRQ